MSFQITTAFVNQFGANIDLLSQQKDSRFMGRIRMESQTGEIGFYEQIGATAAVEIADKSLKAVVTEEYDPAFLPNYDRTRRNGVPEKTWKPLTIGSVKLNKGSTKVVIRAVDIPGKKMFDLKAVKLKRIG